MKNLLALLLITTFHCMAQTNYPTVGHIERYDSSVNAIIGPDAKAEIIATGFEWSEGPLWLEKQKMLLFSDVPRNIIYQWTEAAGTKVYLTPSGYTGSAKRGGETGSNGLLLDKEGRLVICQHGNRQVARMEAPLDKPAPVFTALAKAYKGKKFNSPNDAAYANNGELFFTDPPYGLEKNMDDPKKEIPFQGVYRVTRSGEVLLVTDTITRPNGIAFSPDGRTLLVANSDSLKRVWYAFDIDASGNVVNGRIFKTAGEHSQVKQSNPDGLKIDKNGNVFATGPGGLWIMNRDGKVLGRLQLDDDASNCAFSPDEKTLYITNHTQVLRLKMR